MQVRNPKIDFQGVPVHYFGGRPFGTHLCNAVSFLFPAGERYFIRSVKRYESRIADPELQRRISLFAGQEKMHALEHERFFKLLEGQGFAVERYLRFYELFAYGVIEKLEPAALSLSVTAALEHFTAIMAEATLGTDLLDDMSPQMRRLYQWHSAEEIEHKAVAFDVFTAVNGNYLLRMIGLLSASMKLAFFWSTAMLWLMWSDRELTMKNVFSGVSRMQSRYPIVSRVFITGIREYLRPGFHPDQNDNYELARKYLGS